MLSIKRPMSDIDMVSYHWSCRSRVFLRPPNIAIALGYPPKLNSKTLLPKTPYPLVTGIQTGKDQESSSLMTTFHNNKRFYIDCWEKKSSTFYLANSPANYINEHEGRICSWVQ